MIVLDANVLIGLFDPADAQHAEAESLLRDHADETMAMSAMTLAEFLIRPTIAAVADKAELFIANLGIVVCPLLADDSRHLARLRAESGLKMPDAVVLWLAQSSSASLMTLDRRLAQVATETGLAVVGLVQHGGELADDCQT